MPHRFLKEIGYNEPYWKRTLALRDLKEVWENGFTANEALNLDISFAEWAYERVCGLLEEVQDLPNWESRIVEIPQVAELPHSQCVPEKNIYSEFVTIAAPEREALRAICENLKFFLHNKFAITPKMHVLAYAHLECACRIWAIMLPHLWY